MYQHGELTSLPVRTTLTGKPKARFRIWGAAVMVGRWGKNNKAKEEKNLEKAKKCSKLNYAAQTQFTVYTIHGVQNSRRTEFTLSLST